MSPKQLWAPWRMEFITSEKKPGACVFCDLVKENEDKKNLILLRSEKVFVILNKFPYNIGHLMVVPYQHTHDLGTLSSEEMSALFSFARKGVEALKLAYKPEAFNLGMNLGQAAGAGIKDHLHLHVVPRWNGDTNFMPVLAETKGMPEHLQTCYEKCISAFRSINS